CVLAHRSLLSTAASSRTMSVCPLVRLLLLSSAKAGNAIPPANSPAPMAPAPPTASPLRKKERRLVECFDCCALYSTIFFRSWLSLSNMGHLEPLKQGF